MPGCKLSEVTVPGDTRFLRNHKIGPCGDNGRMPNQPVVFISHGAPTFALEPGLLGPKLAALGQGLHGVRAVLVVSAHWQAHGADVTGAAAPSTVHDFGGFPEALYRLRYPAPGAPELAAEAVALLRAAKFESTVDLQRGLDHGAWVPLLHLFPRADVPVLQVALPRDLGGESALRLGAALAPLRQRGVLLVGSGGITHNLRDYFRGPTAAVDYVPRFVAWARDRLQARDAVALAHYRSATPDGVRAHPSEEHFLPLLVAFGASDSGDKLQVLEGGIDHQVLSMDSFVWGLTPAPRA